MLESKFLIPEGFTFKPSDQTLIEYYLYRKVCGLPIPCVDSIVRQCDIYGCQEPWEIWESCGGPVLNYDGDLYVFTELKKKTLKGSRICRKVGSGSWKGEDAAEGIVSQQPQGEVVIGYKKRFSYKNKGSKDNGGWIMHEYSIHPSLLLGQNQDKNYVLCRIRKNYPGGKDKRSSGFAKKRKLEDVQSDMHLIPYQQQMLCQSEVPMVATILEQEASCTSDMISESGSTIFQRLENGELDSSTPVSDFATHNSGSQSLGLEGFLISQENQNQIICFNNQFEKMNQTVRMLEDEEAKSGTTEMLINNQVLPHEPVPDVAVAVPCERSSNQLREPEMFLIPQENQQQTIWFNNIGSCQSEDTMVAVPEQEASCHTDVLMMSQQILSPPPSDSKNHILQELMMRDQQEDPLAGISDEDFALLQKVFLGTEPEMPVTVADETSETMQLQYASDSDLLFNFDEDVFFSIDQLLQ